MVVSFFGHRDIIQDEVVLLKSTIIDVIEKYGAETFLVGNEGGFDRLVQNTLKDIGTIYPQIRAYHVLAYMPSINTNKECEILKDKIIFEGAETVPPKLAIVRRNQWMIEQADIVIVYVTHSIGGAAQSKKLAEKKGKTVINIPELNHQGSL